MSDDESLNEEQEQTPANCPVIPAEQLFKESREVWIEHQGERYRLRITRRGRLVLQK